MTDRTLTPNNWLIAAGLIDDVSSLADRFETSNSDVARKLLNLGYNVWLNLEEEQKEQLIAGAGFGEIEIQERGEENE